MIRVQAQAFDTAAELAKLKQGPVDLIPVLLAVSPVLPGRRDNDDVGLDQLRILQSGQHHVGIG